MGAYEGTMAWKLAADSSRQRSEMEWQIRMHLRLGNGNLLRDGACAWAPGMAAWGNQGGEAGMRHSVHTPTNRRSWERDEDVSSVGTVRPVRGMAWGKLGL